MDALKERLLISREGREAYAKRAIMLVIGANISNVLDLKDEDAETKALDFISTACRLDVERVKSILMGDWDWDERQLLLGQAADVYAAAILYMNR